MSNSTRAILREMVVHRPEFVGELLGLLEHPVPAHVSGEVVEPVEDCDAAVVLRDAVGAPALAVSVLVCVETGDPGRWSWPLYLVSMWARYDYGPSTLLVLCPDADVARWAVRPIDDGPGSVQMTPQVVGPEQVPVIDDPAVALRSPEMAVLSGMAHGADRPAVLDALARALPALGERQAFLYLGLVYARLPADARTRLENAYLRALADAAPRGGRG